MTPLVNTVEFVSALCDAEPAHVETLVNEASDVQRRMVLRDATRRYRLVFSLGRRSSLALYAVVRLVKPRLVVETGVADGTSTAMMLAAMDANDVGVLHSVDISTDVGSLVTDLSRWQLHIVEPESRKDLPDLLSTLGPLDLFLHDSSHSYDQQRFEYELAWHCLRSDGLLLSDDINWTSAFEEFSRSVGGAPLALRDGLHRLGALRRLRSST